LLMHCSTLCLLALLTAWPPACLPAWLSAYCCLLHRYDYKFEIDDDDKLPCFCQAYNCRKTLN
jgi:hypothetical protein